MVIRDLSQSGPTNRGGGYVAAHRYEASSGRHTLYIDGPEGAVAQVLMTDPTYERRRWQTLFGHALDGAGSCPSPATTTLLELLRGAVIVPCGSSLDFAIALDWYNTIVDESLGGHTALADLVSRGKYWYKGAANPQKLREVGLAIVAELVEFIEQHPLLSRMDAIAAVPGHDAAVVSFGARVADAVARQRGIPLVRCASRAAFRPPAKSLEPAARAGVLHEQFHCPTDVSGQHVLIVDDVYSSGATAEETARALRAAGAASVVSLAAVRTMKFL